jgi:hypothetical protein
MFVFNLLERLSFANSNKRVKRFHEAVKSPLTPMLRPSESATTRDVDHDHLARPQLGAQLLYQNRPALTQFIELGFETANEAASRAVGCELDVFPTAKIELELCTSDGYTPRVSWLAQAAVSGCLFC